MIVAVLAMVGLAVGLSLMVIGITAPTLPRLSLPARPRHPRTLPIVPPAGPLPDGVHEYVIDAGVLTELLEEARQITREAVRHD